jgi:hypothetical protein
MRLELNLPALERLLGGDTEVELHLRHQIVEEFTRKNIKSLINDETLRKLTEIWKNEAGKMVEEAAGKLFEEKYERGGLGTMRYKIEEAIDDAVKNSLERALEEFIEKMRRQLEARIERAVEAAMQSDVSRRVEEEIQRRLDLAKKMGKEDTNAI